MLSFRYTRVPSGCVSSPFLLGATLQEHLTSLEEEYPESVEKFKKELYIDDIISGGAQQEELINQKQVAMDIFNLGGFTLHKRHSSMPTLEEHSVPYS